VLVLEEALKKAEEDARRKAEEDRKADEARKLEEAKKVEHAPSLKLKSQAVKTALFEQITEIKLQHSVPPFKTVKPFYTTATDESRDSN